MWKLVQFVIIAVFFTIAVQLNEQPAAGIVLGMIVALFITMIQVRLWHLWNGLPVGTPPSAFRHLVAPPGRPMEIGAQLMLLIYAGVFGMIGTALVMDGHKGYAYGTFIQCWSIFLVVVVGVEIRDLLRRWRQRRVVPRFVRRGPSRQ